MPDSSVRGERARDQIAARLTSNNFDLLRLTFAAMVVAYHTSILSQSPALAWIQAWTSADFGVQGFYVVSGFLVTMSFDKSRSLLSYAQKRLQRIAPAYLTVILAAAVLLVLISRLPWTAYFCDHQWASYVFWNVLLMNFASPDLPGVFEGNYKQAVNGSLWTIKIEVAFYCMVPAVAWLGRRAGLWRVWVGLAVASIIWRIGFDVLGQYTVNYFWSKLAIQAPGQFAFFIAGALVYERTRLGLMPPHAWMAGSSVATYALSEGTMHMLVAPLAVGIIVYWAAIACPKIADVGRYGDFSYGIYLWHWPLLQIFVVLGLFAASPVLSAVAVFATILAVAVLSWFVVERPFLSLRRLARAG